MKYLVFHTLEEARRYRRAIGDAVSRFCINELGYIGKKTPRGLEPLGKRKRTLVNDSYTKRTGKVRRSKTTWRWNPPISLMCAEAKERRFKFLIEDFRPLLLNLILANKPSVNTRTIRKYFGRFLGLKVLEFESIEIYAAKTFDVEELKSLKLWVEANTGYTLDDIDVSKVASYAPYSDLVYLMDFIDSNPEYFNHIIEVLES